ncbi:MAG TPA: hypothetical protein VFR58_11070 [Flavisolibacter sp.]|nr:hypothetical protein [Flavisolibacter sp.]
MKKISFIGCLLIAACNSSTSPGSESKDTASAGSPVPVAAQNEASLAGCYRQVVGRDTIRLELRQTGDSVYGNMAFDNYEKDASSGTVRGRASGEQLTLWYDFFSEGMRSVMEIVLKQNASGLVMGTGPVKVRADTAMFEDHGNLEFKQTGLLEKVPCSNR